MQLVNFFNYQHITDQKKPIAKNILEALNYRCNHD